MNIVGRLLIRNDKIVGIYIPFVPNGIDPGVYNVSVILDEIVLTRIGDASENVDNYDPNELCKMHREFMTKDEIYKLENR